MNTPHTHWLVKLQAFWLLLALAAVIGFRASLLPWRPALLATAAAGRPAPVDGQRLPQGWLRDGGDGSALAPRDLTLLSGRRWL